ncbi:MAG: hypothetical protein ACJ8AT_13695 [Hyalangium sp.]|uniref:hypothetical protein n=1 Tax=Hyalangium sp. TaxID=2028555 RepID=UPI003899EC30
MSDSENAKGRGAQVFDPYQASASGAIRLSLQWYNGCAMLPTGQTVPKNSTPIPYPNTCPDPTEAPPFPNVHPPGELRLLANNTYFWNQFTVTDTVVNKHTNGQDMSAPLNWIKRESRFKNLDWTNVGQSLEDWLFFNQIPGTSQDRWSRVVYFDNASWRQVKDDSFKLEFLDAEGTVRGTPVEYKRSEFLVESAQSGHTSFTWRVEGVGPPKFPGDTEVHPLPEIPGWPPQSPTYRTIARMDVVGSTNPFKTFKTPDLRGPGAVRVTWSQLPDEPFYFPVTYVTKDDIAPTCYDDNGNQTVQCGFGINPTAKFIPPANGQYYVPGEVVNIMVDVRDGDGNRLHHPDQLPSTSDFNANKTNGLLYASLPTIANLTEVDQFPMVNVAGPLQNMKTASNPKEPKPYWTPAFAFAMINETSTTPALFGDMEPAWNTRYGVQLPKNAQPGTYVALVKFNRYWLGERVAKLKPFFFQVGTTEKTRYPGRVGNCQMCHRGVLSLDNLRHGLSVDHVEACKTCHATENSNAGSLMEHVHRIHMRSAKYPMPKNDCTTCHLQKESATRPSLFACTSCHPSAHGEQYFASKFVNGTEPSQYGNCAQSCHGDKPPQLHILPQN